jgi:hypothetical protein
VARRRRTTTTWGRRDRGRGRDQVTDAPREHEGEPVIHDKRKIDPETLKAREQAAGAEPAAGGAAGDAGTPADPEAPADPAPGLAELKAENAQLARTWPGERLVLQREPGVHRLRPPVPGERVGGPAGGHREGGGRAADGARRRRPRPPARRPEGPFSRWPRSSRTSCGPTSSWSGTARWGRTSTPPSTRRSWTPPRRTSRPPR